jgi:hypothetical protein
MNLCEHCSADKRYCGCSKFAYSEDEATALAERRAAAAHHECIQAVMFGGIVQGPMVDEAIALAKQVSTAHQAALKLTQSNTLADALRNNIAAAKHEICHATDGPVTDFVIISRGCRLIGKYTAEVVANAIDEALREFGHLNANANANTPFPKCMHCDRACGH